MVRIDILLVPHPKERKKNVFCLQKRASFLFLHYIIYLSIMGSNYGGDRVKHPPQYWKTCQNECSCPCVSLPLTLFCWSHTVTWDSTSRFGTCEQIFIWWINIKEMSDEMNVITSLIITHNLAHLVCAATDDCKLQQLHHGEQHTCSCRAICQSLWLE